MTEPEKKELRQDVESFINLIEQHPEKALTLIVQARQNRLCGSSVELNKPAGKNLKFA